MKLFSWQMLIGLLLGVTAVTPPSAQAAPLAAGDVVRTIDGANFASAQLALHPTEPILFATSYLNGSLVAVDTQRLSILYEVSIGLDPTNLAISPNGDKVYVANRNGISIVDTRSQAVESLQLNFLPHDVAYGYDDRLWLLDRARYKIEQISATTGLRTGPALNAGSDGMLEESPDRRTLYYATSGVSPATFYEFDIASATPKQTWRNRHGALGSNGEDIVVSHGGDFVAFVTASGNKITRPNDIGLLDAADKNVLGVLDVGPYPREMALSPDDQTAYIFRKSGQIELFDLNSFQRANTWHFENPLGSSYVTNLIVDNSGRYLFAVTSPQLTVFSTGLQIPEPSFSSTILSAVAVLTTSCGRKRCKSTVARF